MLTGVTVSLGHAIPWWTNTTMDVFHIPQYTIQNRNVHISVLNGVLWDMRQDHFGFCGIVLYSRLYVLLAFVMYDLMWNSKTDLPVSCASLSGRQFSCDFQPQYDRRWRCTTLSTLTWLSCMNWCWQMTTMLSPIDLWSMSSCRDR